MSRCRGATRARNRPAFLVALAAVFVSCSGGATAFDETASTASTPEVTPTPVPSTTASTTSSSTAVVPLSTTTTAAPTTSTEPEPFRWNLMAGGDVLMDRTEPAGLNPFSKITPALGTATISLVNVEMAISDRGFAIPGKEFSFRAPPSAAKTIAAAGIDVATLGNNHARDFGSDALLDTIDLLTEAGVVVVGAGRNDTEAFTPRVIRVGDRIDVAFIGATLIVPAGFPATPDRAGVANGKERNRVIANVRVAAEKFDVVVVTLHWGIERATCPSSSQRSFANELLDAGATAVIGHHPHVLQPIEFEDGKVNVFSLGNFVWHPRTSITADTGVVELQFEDDTLVDVVFHPHSLDENGAPAPVSEGFRFDRIVDIIGGECAKHQPPPLPPPTTVADTTTTSEPDVVTTTTVATVTTTTAAADG